MKTYEELSAPKYMLGDGGGYTQSHEQSILQELRYWKSCGRDEGVLTGILPTWLR
jgi:hypothetical protein